MVFENKLVGGLVDIGHCIYVDENASNAIWLYVVRDKNDNIKSIEKISEKDAWKKIEQ